MGTILCHNTALLFYSNNNNYKQLIRVPRGKHSQKPLEVLQGIEKMFPTQDKIELFARHKPENWDVWGLDVQEVWEDSEDYHISNG